MTSQWRFDKQQFILFINYHKIIVLLKLSPAVHRIHLPAGRRASITALSARNGLRTNCLDFIPKDQWSLNLSNINPMDYRVWGAMLEAYCKLKTKPKTITEVKKALLVIWGNLGDRSTRLWKTWQIKRLKACVGAWSWRWTLRTFTVTMEFCHQIIN